MEENENVSRETEITPTPVIDYTQDFQSIKNALDTQAGTLSNLLTQLGYNNTLLGNISSQLDTLNTATYFVFVLVMFEVFRFIKGLFKGVLKND